MSENTGAKVPGSDQKKGNRYRVILTDDSKKLLKASGRRKLGVHPKPNQKKSKQAIAGDRAKKWGGFQNQGRGDSH